MIFLCEQQERGNKGPRKIRSVELQGDQEREGRIAVCWGIGSGRIYGQGLFTTTMLDITF